MRLGLGIAVLLLAGCAAKHAEQAATVTRLLPKECITSDILCVDEACSHVKFLSIPNCSVLSVNKPTEEPK